MTASVAEHRPALRRRRFRHDNLVAVDLFSGFGGLTKGIEQAGFTTIMAANHNEYKILVHEANHPTAEHWRADLVDPEASDYHSARDLPAADMLAAGISCKNHTVANSKKAYAEGLSLFELDDPEYEASVTRSERDRATANCVLHYAAQHRPRLILIECTTELTSWGSRIPGTKIGDGSTYRWWLKQFELLGYKYRVLYLNSMFFGVPQSRDRLYIAMWDRRIPTPDLDHRPPSWCSFCGRMVEAVWTWKTGVPPSGSVRYGTQYEYRCQSCRGIVIPPMTPSLAALDLSDLGTRIGDRDKPLADTTMARAERCRQRFAEFPAVLVPAKAQRGSERHLGSRWRRRPASRRLRCCRRDGCLPDIATTGMGSTSPSRWTPLPRRTRKRCCWRSTTTRVHRGELMSRCRRSSGRRPWACCPAVSSRTGGTPCQPWLPSPCRR